MTVGTAFRMRERRLRPALAAPRVLAGRTPAGVPPREEPATVTVFMLKVSDAVSGRAPVPELPAVQRSRGRSVGHGAHEMVELRSLAEQLVSEANAVLADTGRELTLEDEVGQGQLAFSLRSGPTWARVVTSFAQRRSWGRLVTPDSVGAAYELTGVEALPELILALVTAGGPHFSVRVQRQDD